MQDTTASAAQSESTRDLNSQPPEMRLGGSGFVLSFGVVSRAAEQKLNEDFWGIAKPPESVIERRGIVAAVADGVSGDGGGRVAAEAAVRAVVEDYYATSESWGNTRALDKVLCSLNDWLLSENLRQRDHEGKVCALSALLFESDRFRVAHVGDTRAYRYRAPHLEQLTTDHTWPRHDMRHVLKRAVGLDTHLIVDYAESDLQSGDVMVLLSDGVWEVLGEGALRSIIHAHADDPQLLAETLVATSREHQLRYMGRNDATALVVRVFST